jgi:hypothetical protein
MMLSLIHTGIVHLAEFKGQQVAGMYSSVNFAMHADSIFPSAAHYSQ